jgi:mannose-6-phosphate isomerase-like protein (cupin superfamily)
MDLIRILETPAERFPSGRETRRLAGVAGLPSTLFAVGHSTLDPDGAIPEHRHPNEEVYLILSGSGTMAVGDEREEVAEGACVFIPPDSPHALRNTGREPMAVLWVYAPATVVDHWAAERSGGLVARPGGCA